MSQDEKEPPTSITGEGELAESFLSQVGVRIRALRTERSMTVQKLADRSQISRRLLTQIELGQANPSLVAITRIARQLGTETTSLLGAAVAEEAIEVNDPLRQVLVWSSAGGSTAHLLAATRESRSADLWLWNLVPGDTYQGHADPAHSQELFYVVSGALTLSADDQVVIVATKSSATLRSDRSYSYTNAGDVTATFVRTVSLAP